MFVFSCPQCGESMRAKPEQSGKACKCLHCKGELEIPEEGEDAAILLVSVKLRLTRLPITADILPPICICCGRDKKVRSEEVILWSHIRSSAGEKLGVFTAGVVASLFFDDSFANATGGGLECLAHFSATSQPFVLFSSVPICTRCELDELKRIRLVGVEGTRLVIKGIPSRFAAMVEELDAREAEAFEESLRQAHKPPDPNEPGFDWSSIKK